MEDQAFVVNEAKGSGQGPAIASNMKLHKTETGKWDITNRIQGKSNRVFHILSK